MVTLPKLIPNWINGIEIFSKNGKSFKKLSPLEGNELYGAVQSDLEDVSNAVTSAKKAQPIWADTTPVKRGEILHDIALKLREHQNEIAKIVSDETGKSMKDALAETSGSIAQGLFMAGEGMRYFGRTTTSSISQKQNIIIRQPIGVTALIVAANTPIANIAWKVFPSLICGNSVVLKAAEDTPATAWFFSKIAHEVGLPPGLLNVIQGYGREAGAALVEHEGIDLISFTGSTAVGQQIAQMTASRLIKTSLELGGKNPLIVCDDADLENAAKWAILSAFSNAGQRCAAASRLIIFESIYEKFRDLLISKVKQLKVGTSDEDDFGPVINQRQLDRMLSVVARAKAEGAKILMGGSRLTGPLHAKGYFMSPTLIENANVDAEISQHELFGPIACLYSVKDFEQALQLANHSSYGLTASIHTKNIDRAMTFSLRIQAGVTTVNGGTYGSEPHMPFGGVKLSGNGTREPGPEALDVYSQLKNICIITSSLYV